MLKRLLYSVLAVSLIASAATAKGKKKFNLGPTVQFGISSFAGKVPVGFKTDIAHFAMQLGAQSEFWTSETFGLGLGLVYDSRAIDFHDQATGNIRTTHSLGYFSIQPGVILNSFRLGVGLGLPMGYTATDQNDKETTLDQYQNFMVEVRLGASVPIMEEKDQTLNFIVNGSYPLTRYTSQLGDEIDGNGPIATLGIGFNYEFSLWTEE
jgi:hypothetical protein